MKKKIFTLLALFAGVLSASAAGTNTISVKKVYITPGGVASFGIDLDNTDELCGFTMFMSLPEGITLNGEQKCGNVGEDGFAINKTARTQGELVDPTGSNPYGLGYISTKALPGNSGAIIQVNIKAASDLAVGTVLNGKIYDINFGALGGGSDIHLAEANFEIEVTDRVILDEESTVAPVAATNVNVTVKRNIKKNVWSTICFPVQLKKAQAEAIFGSDAKYATLASFKPAYDEETTVVTGITLNFTEYTLGAVKPLKAGNVYLVKTTKDLEQFDVDNVTIATSVNPTNVNDTEDLGLKGTFTGSFVKTEIPKDALFFSNNKFYYSAGATNTKAFRGWIVLDAILNQALVSDAPIYFDIDGEATKIDATTVFMMPNDGQYYNLKGQKVDNPTEKGVYIKNGKKVVIK